MKIIIKKIIIHNQQLQNIINNDLKEFILIWAKVEVLLNKKEISENQEAENELIKNIQFLNALKDELNTNYMLTIDSKNIYDNIIKKEYIKLRKEWGHHYYINYDYFKYNWNKLRLKILNDFNKNTKFSNQKQKQQIINEHFKTKKEKKNYENWKTNYFRNINEKIINNNIIEEGIDTLEYFKNEINTNNLSNPSPINTHKITPYKM